MLSDGRAQWEEQEAAAVIIRRKHTQAVCWEETAHPSCGELFQWFILHNVPVVKMACLSRERVGSRLDEEIGSQLIDPASLGKCPWCVGGTTGAVRVRMPRAAGLMLAQ